MPLNLKSKTPPMAPPPLVPSKASMPAVLVQRPKWPPRDGLLQYTRGNIAPGWTRRNLNALQAAKESYPTRVPRPPSKVLPSERLQHLFQAKHHPKNVAGPRDRPEEHSVILMGRPVQALVMTHASSPPIEWFFPSQMCLKPLVPRCVLGVDAKKEVPPHDDSSFAPFHWWKDHGDNVGVPTRTTESRHNGGSSFQGPRTNRGPMSLGTMMFRKMSHPPSTADCRTWRMRATRPTHCS